MPKFVGNCLDVYSSLIEPGDLLIAETHRISTIKKAPTYTLQKSTKIHLGNRYSSCKITGGQEQKLTYQWLNGEHWSTKYLYRWVDATCSCGHVIKLDPDSDWQLPFIIHNDHLNNILDKRIQKANENW